MTTASLAPFKRATMFFGAMALAVTALTAGANFQTTSGQSSEAIAQAKIQRGIATDAQLAAEIAKPTRVIARSAATAAQQQASLPNPNAVR